MITFLLGNVNSDTYDEMVGKNTCKQLCSIGCGIAAKCCDCVYHPYCGVCPVVAYSSSGDIFQLNLFDFRCRVYKGIQDILFQLLQNDDFEIMLTYILD